MQTITKMNASYDMKFMVANSTYHGEMLHFTVAPTKIEVATSNDSGGDTFTRKYIT